MIGESDVTTPIQRGITHNVGVMQGAMTVATIEMMTAAPPG